MSKPTLTDKVICFDSRIDIFFVNTNCNTHEHVLRAFYHFTINLQQVRFFKSFKSEIIVAKVTIINDC